MKKFILVLTTLLILSSCSTKQAASFFSIGNGFSKDTAYMVENYSMDNLKSIPEENLDIEKKIIITANGNIETQNFKNTLDNINNLLAKYDGYIQSSDSGTDWENKNYCNYNLRIPSDSFSDFVKDLQDKESFTNFSTNTNDVTIEYYDYQAQIDSLVEEEKVVSDLYDKATGIEDILKIEDKLSQIKSELNVLRTRIKNYDLLTQYSTISIYVLEVKLLTETTFTGKLENACLQSWEDFKLFCENFLFWLIHNVWYILISLIIIWFIILVIHCIKKAIKKLRRKRLKKEKEELLEKIKNGEFVKINEVKSKDVLDDKKIDGVLK